MQCGLKCVGGVSGSYAGPCHQACHCYADCAYASRLQLCPAAVRPLIGRSSTKEDLSLSGGFAEEALV